MFAIDCHDHVYMKRLAPKAVQSVGEFYEVDMSCTGTDEELIEISERSPIKRFVINSVALNARTVKRLNDFMAKEQQQYSEFAALGTLHPEMELSELEAEIDRIEELGLHGVKLHPDTQDFDMDSPGAMRIYERLEGRLPLLIHCGDHRYDRSHPRRLMNVLSAFPKLTVVAAHFGGWSIFDQAVPYMTDARCYMDISSSFPFIGRERVYEYIKLYGAERLLFGSDFPMWDPIEEYNNLMELPLRIDEQKKILYENAAQIFGIDTTGMEDPE